MQPIMWVLLAALLVLIVYRNVVGRFVNPRRVVAEPLLVVVAGVVVAARSGVDWTGVGIAVAAAVLVVSAGLGIVRAHVTRLSVREGRLFARGGAVVLVLWVLTIGVGVGVGVLTAATAAGETTAATAVLSIGVGLAVQAAVLVRRAEGRRPVPAGSAPTGCGPTACCAARAAS